jgi:hypothetical protein
MGYLSSLFLEVIHLIPQSGLLFTSTDHATTEVTMLLSLSFLTVTMVDIAQKYFEYTMFGMVDFWERAVWTHGVKVVSLVISSGCLFLSLSLTSDTVTESMPSSDVAAEPEFKGGNHSTVL